MLYWFSKCVIYQGYPFHINGTALLLISHRDSHALDIGVHKHADVFSLVHILQCTEHYINVVHYWMPAFQVKLLWDLCGVICIIGMQMTVSEEFRYADKVLSKVLHDNTLYDTIDSHVNTYMTVFHANKNMCSIWTVELTNQTDFGMLIASQFKTFVFVLLTISALFFLLKVSKQLEMPSIWFDEDKSLEYSKTCNHWPVLTLEILQCEVIWIIIIY